jgi:hypothetical protein
MNDDVAVECTPFTIRWVDAANVFTFYRIDKSFDIVFLLKEKSSKTSFDIHKKNGNVSTRHVFFRQGFRNEETGVS